MIENSDRMDSTSQMELNLVLGSGSKRKRCQDMDDHQPLKRKKFNRHQDIDELSGASDDNNEFFKAVLTTFGAGCFLFERDLTGPQTIFNCYRPRWFNLLDRDQDLKMGRVKHG